MRPGAPFAAYLKTCACDQLPPLNRSIVLLLFDL